jgi:phospholipid N-methyltransferase
MNDDSSRSSPTATGATPGAWTFFRQWLKNPRAMAAFAPSGRQLTRQMMAQIPVGARHIVELGAGTGVFTRALLEQGIAESQLLVVELNKELARLLQRQFPSSLVVNGDACDLAGIVARSGFARAGSVDAVISGLGFLAMPRVLQKQILQAVFAVLGTEAPLIQFTYGPSNPLPRDLLAELDLNVRRAGIALMNVPPAVVYVYTRNRSMSIRAVRADSSVARD